MGNNVEQKRTLVGKVVRLSELVDYQEGAVAGGPRGGLWQ